MEEQRRLEAALSVTHKHGLDDEVAAAIERVKKSWEFSEKDWEEYIRNAVGSTERKK